MTPREIDLILKRLDQQDADNTQWRNEQREDLHELKRDVKEVKAETKYTNGRVTQLEKINEREAGAREATDGTEQRREKYLDRKHAWRIPVAAALVGATLMVPGYLIVDWLVTLLHLR